MRTLTTVLAFCFSPCFLLPLHAAETYRTIAWEDLIPKGWDPAKEFRALDLANMKDSDPRAMDALQRMKELWEQAPTEASMDGRKVRLPGFVIPLERKGEDVVEFLLVPYFGACIHTPPPPANQIIHAVSAKPRGKMRSMEAFWVSGTLEIAHTETPWGGAGYRLRVDQIQRYEEPRKK
jgi:hypothetical protein